MNMDDYVTVAQAAERLSVIPETVVAAIARGKLPATKTPLTGRQWLILKTDLEEYIERTRPNGEKPAGRVPLAERATDWSRVPRLLKDYVATHDEFADAKSMQWVERRVTNREWEERKTETGVASISFQVKEQKGFEPGLWKVEPVHIFFAGSSPKGERYYIGRNDEANRIYFAVVPADMDRIGVFEDDEDDE